MSRRSQRSDLAEEPLLELPDEALDFDDEELMSDGYSDSGDEVDTNAADNADVDDDDDEEAGVRNNDEPVQPVVEANAPVPVAPAQTIPTYTDPSQERTSPTDSNMSIAEDIATMHVTTPREPPTILSDLPPYAQPAFRARARKAFALHDACELGDLAFLRALFTPLPTGQLNPLAAAVDLDQRDLDECTPLHVCLLHGRLQCAAVLLQQGAEVALGCEGNSVLHLPLLLAGAYSQHQLFAVEALRLLLDNGADVLATDDLGRTALQVASLFNMPEAAAVLLAAAAKGSADGLRGGKELQRDLLFAVDNEGRNALHYAAQGRAYHSMVQLLGLMRAEVEALAARGYALQLMPPRPALTADTDVSALVGAGVGMTVEHEHVVLRARDVRGWSPLHTALYAAQEHYASVAEALQRDAVVRALLSQEGVSSLLAGCVEDVCVLGRTAVQWAERNRATQRLLPHAATTASTSVSTSTSTSASAEIVSSPSPSPLLISWSPLCFAHHTAPRITRRGAPPPPENVRRLQVLLNYADGALRSDALNCEAYGWRDTPLTSATATAADVPNGVAAADAAASAPAAATGVVAAAAITPHGTLPPRRVPAWLNRARPAALADVLRCHEYPYLHRILAQVGPLEPAAPVSVSVDYEHAHAGQCVTIDVGTTRIQAIDRAPMLAGDAAVAPVSASGCRDYIPPAHVACLSRDGFREASVGDAALTNMLLHNNSLAPALHHHCLPRAATDEALAAAEGVFVPRDELLATAAVVRDSNGAPVLTDAAAADALRCAPIPRGVPLPSSDAVTPFSPPVVPLAYLDGDTSVSRHSLTAALHAAGIVTDAVDRVMDPASGYKHAFCVVRPPGHHAGPTGIVYNDDRVGASHGFCLFNNIAIGAAYAKCQYRDRVRRVAIIDFDVHHGNGTEAIVRNLRPNVHESRLSDEYNESIVLRRQCFKPWLDWDDADNVLFASVHGLQQQDGPWFYPGSGNTSAGVAVAVEQHVVTPDSLPAALAEHDAPADLGGAGALEQDVMLEALESRHARVVNVGMGLSKKTQWRQVWRHVIIPKLLEHKPDVLFVSAGFDAHKRDDINLGYVGVDEDDYYWLTKQLIKVANTCCEGRIVSALEGGYRIHGKIASPFAKSVMAHVQALNEGCGEVWDPEAAAWEREREDWCVAARHTVQQLKVERFRALQEAARQRQLAMSATLSSSSSSSSSSSTALDAMAADADADAAAASSLTASAGGRSRRARAPVDYVALNAELERKRKEKKQRMQ